MISSMNTTKPSGSTAIQCDAGTPISGRTGDTGTYEILNLLPGGGISQGQNITAPYISPPNQVVLPPGGALLAGIYIGIVNTAITIPVTGVYNLKPFVIFPDATGTGAIEIILTDVNSGLSAYAPTRAPFSDPYDPAPVDFALVDSGYYWSNIPLEAIGTTSRRSSINTAQDRNYYMQAGDYNAILVCRTAFTTATADAIFGFEVAQRIS